jgi:hypothetical protein
MASNPILNVNGQGLARLKAAMALADDGEGSFRRSATGYAISAGRLVFFQYASDKAQTLFPSPISLDRAAEIAFDWLATQEYGPEPDHDGDNERGWRLFRDRWGHIDGLGYSAFVAVEPCWIEFGK